MYSLVGVACPARQLLKNLVRCEEAELMEVVLALLYLHFIEMHRALVYPHGCAGLHPFRTDAVACYALGEMRHGWLCAPSSSHHLTPYVHQSVEESAGGHHHSLCSQLCPPDGPYSRHLRLFFAIGVGILMRQQLVCLVLPDAEVGRVVEHAPPFPNEFCAVALSSRAPYGRTFAAVEHTELYGCGVGHPCHLSSQSVNFSHYLPFGYSSNGGVAAHLRNLVHVHGHKTGSCAHVGGGGGCLASCVSSADYQYIILKVHRVLNCPFTFYCLFVAYKITAFYPIYEVL